MNPDDLTPKGSQDAALEEAPDATLEAFEKLVADLARPSYVFSLFVSGTTQRSSRAVDHVRHICDHYLPGRYELKVVDVYQQPAETRLHKVIAVPTLIKELPLPAQTFVGDMSNTDRIVIALNLHQEAGKKA